MDLGRFIDGFFLEIGDIRDLRARGSPREGQWLKCTMAGLTLKYLL